MLCVDQACTLGWVDRGQVNIAATFINSAHEMPIVRVAFSVSAQHCTKREWYLQIIKEPVPEDEDDDAEKKKEDDGEEKTEDEEEDAAVEEVEEEKPEPKTVDKTVWDWVLINDNKPLWTRKCVTFVTSVLKPYNFQEGHCGRAPLLVWSRGRRTNERRRAVFDQFKIHVPLRKCNK